jgi:hypothetical protein
MQHVPFIKSKILNINIFFLTVQGNELDRQIKSLAKYSNKVYTHYTAYNILHTRMEE